MARDSAGKEEGCWEMLMSPHNSEFSELPNFLFWGYGGAGISYDMVVNRYLVKILGTRGFSYNDISLKKNLVEHLEDKINSFFREKEGVVGMIIMTQRTSGFFISWHWSITGLIGGQHGVLCWPESCQENQCSYCQGESGALSLFRSCLWFWLISFQRTPLRLGR